MLHVFLDKQIWTVEECLKVALGVWLFIIFWKIDTLLSWEMLHLLSQFEILLITWTSWKFYPINSVTFPRELWVRYTWNKNTQNLCLRVYSSYLSSFLSNERAKQRPCWFSQMGFHGKICVSFLYVIDCSKLVFFLISITVCK